MKKIVLVCACLALLFTGISCTDGKHAKQLLERQGYTDVQIGGYDWFGCSESDIYQTEFTAKNPNGMTVEGTVCKGWFKKSTIRFE